MMAEQPQDQKQPGPERMQEGAKNRPSQCEAKQWIRGPILKA